MRVTVVGAGYVGLVTGVCLAARGHRVTLIEKAAERSAELRAGRVPIVEPRLQELFDEHRSAIDVRDAIPVEGPGDLTFIAVGTPIEAGDSDLSQLVGALGELSAWPTADVSVRSTLPPGMSHRLPSYLGRSGAKNLSTNPEFLRQGSAVADFLNPSRIVFGHYPETAARHITRVEEAYAGLPGSRLRVDVTSAELIKNVSNAFLALKLSFVNEIASLADEYGADVDEILEGIGLDPRIGTQYMRPGLGFGGSCLPKELQVLAVAGRKRGLSMHLARAASLVNAEQQDRFARIVVDALGQERARVGLLGLTFKAGTDDLRGSPALAVAGRLLDAGHEVVAFDPAAAAERIHATAPQIKLAATAEGVFEGADCVVLATEWPAFATLDFVRLRRGMRHGFFFDGRNLLDLDQMKAAGYEYRGIGRGRPTAMTIE